MSNPFNSENGQQNKAGGSGAKEKPGSGKPNGKLAMKTAAWPGVPGKTGPNRNTTGVKEVKQYADNVGV